MHRERMKERLVDRERVKDIGGKWLENIVMLVAQELDLTLIGKGCKAGG